MMEEVFRQAVPAGEFGVELFDDADPGRNPAAPWAYDAAGFGNMTPGAMREFMEVSPEERDQAAGLCSFKKARIWFRFMEPQPHAALAARQDVLEAELEVHGWTVRAGLDDIRAPRFEGEAEEAFAEWLYSGREPELEVLARFTAAGVWFIISKPEELPSFSGEEKKFLEDWAVSSAARLFGE